MPSKYEERFGLPFFTSTVYLRVHLPSAVLDAFVLEEMPTDCVNNAPSNTAAHAQSRSAQRCSAVQSDVQHRLRLLHVHQEDSAAGHGPSRRSNSVAFFAFFSQQDQDFERECCSSPQCTVCRSRSLSFSLTSFLPLPTNHAGLFCSAASMGFKPIARLTFITLPIPRGTIILFLDLYVSLDHVWQSGHGYINRKCV